jgi:hypothetical protein
MLRFLTLRRGLKPGWSQPWFSASTRQLAAPCCDLLSENRCGDTICARQRQHASEGGGPAQAGWYSAVSTVRRCHPADSP